MAIIAVLRKCLSQHANSFPTNVKMSKKNLVWSSGLVAYLHADPTLQIKDLHTYVYTHTFKYIFQKYILFIY